MKHYAKLIAAATIGSAALLTTACDINQTREAELPDVDVSAESGQLPEYEVVKTQDGEMPSMDVDVEGGKLPAYDVETADIQVETKTVEVEVPKDVDIVMPDEKADADS